MSEELLDSLVKIIRKVEKETKAAVGDKYHDWIAHFNNWIVLPLSAPGELGHRQGKHELHTYLFLFFIHASKGLGMVVCKSNSCFLLFTPFFILANDPEKQPEI